MPPRAPQRDPARLPQFAWVLAFVSISGVAHAQASQSAPTGTVTVHVRATPAAAERAAAAGRAERSEQAKPLEAPGSPLADALVRSGHVAAETDVRGEARLTLPAGPARVVVTKIGFASDSLTVMVRAGVDTAITVDLRAHVVELESVVVQATRGQRRVENEPTRVEVLGHEEVEEETAMTPGNVARFLSEAGGVRVQTTSPAFGTANVRVQGLRGRYTELLSDGLPLYGLTTEGLGLVQIPPVDLQQVELIKGTASALYGPTALGGVINFVSRRPGPPASRELLLNQTSQDGTDAAFFAAQPLGGGWGGTLLAAGNRQARLDLSHEGWADVPSYQRGVIRPRLFWTGAGGSSLFVTTGFTAESRDGGTLPGDVVPAGVPFPESRSTRRADAGTVARLVLGEGLALSLRASATGEWQDLVFGGARERDRRNTEFAEATLTLTRGVQEVVFGTAFQRDGFDSRDVPALDYTFTAPAVFVQHTWVPTERFALTSSARLDIHNVYGTIFSPRVSALARITRSWTARLSGGLGAYAPTPFVEETDEIGFARLRAISNLEAERGRSAEADLTGQVGPVELSGSVYASVIDHAVDIRAVSTVPDSVELVNGTSPTRTAGVELFARYRIGRYALIGTYDYRHATEQDVETGGRRAVPLTPTHAAGLVPVWEPKDDTGIGLEAFYTGRQSLQYDPYRSQSKPYVLIGALARLRIGRAVLWVNGEDLNNVRQTHTDRLLLPTPGLGGRWTTDVWAPLDGAVLNAGIRVTF
ncbi:MAG TPA: TonB-dependent receptor [Gemmatimonadales bacterium]|nr:TonB-dependent receptor [Gemmatimonadales bacterium]